MFVQQYSPVHQGQRWLQTGASSWAARTSPAAGASWAPLHLLGAANQHRVSRGWLGEGEQSSKRDSPSQMLLLAEGQVEYLLQQEQHLLEAQLPPKK